MTSPDSANPKDQFGLPPHAMESLKRVFAHHPAIEGVTVYGSRAKGNYRYNSDIDVMLTAPELSWSEFCQLELEIDDLLLPWKVDLALKHQVENEDLLEHVERVGVRVL
ncbi:MAG: DNA polymerase subunit beta [Marinobacter sp. T13-3]|jgi:predicted nucleotidyltransferase|nr:MAG: DNA polymerase subunit beta [Marinobacter sp. T13-3]